jgi:transcriptional regulator with GAF, ATPase, and Fis domain
MAAPMKSLVVMLGIAEQYARAFHDWAHGQGRSLVSLPAADLKPWPAGSVALAALGVDRDADAAPARISTVRSAIGGAPLVVFAQNLGIDAVTGLMHAGVADVIGPATPPASAVARACSHAAPRAPIDALIGESDAMTRMRRELAAVAPMRSTVLLTGETGVGKGYVARLVHALSGQAGRPFVHVDCAALAPSVIESELFGHEKGSFTGATAARTGRFELAGDGTIFLDEIGDLDPGLQTKLLRVLQDRAYERIGGTATRSMQARVIAATNRELRACVENGSFRADLYFRLKVFEIRIPSLRERRSDVPALARNAARRIAADLRIPVPPLPDAVVERLAARDWPGNVRELMNEVERILILRRAGFDVDVPAVATPADGPSLSERTQLERALRASGGNISRAARRIGMARSTLRYKIGRNELSHLIPRD